MISKSHRKRMRNGNGKKEEENAMKNKNNHRSVWIFVIAALALLGIALPAKADSLFWKTAADGPFMEKDNWVDDKGDDAADYPGASDVAWFDKTGTYTVSLGADHTVHRVYVITNAAGALNLTLELGGNTLIANRDTDNQVFRIAGSASSQDDTRTLRLENGTMNARGGLRLNEFGTNRPTATLVVGDGATLQTMDYSGLAGTIAVGGGSSSPGELYVEDGGALLVPDRLDVGATQNVIDIGLAGNGYISVDGTGTATFGRHNVALATAGGDGTLEVSGGGAVSNIDNLRLGWNSENVGEATVLVTGSDGERASTLEFSRLFLSFDGRTTGTLKVADGGEVTILSNTGGGGGVDNESYIGSRGTVEIDGGTLIMKNNPTVETAVNIMEWDVGSTYKLTLHDKDATPLRADGEVQFLSEGSEGVNFILAGVDAEFEADLGDYVDILKYGSLTGEFEGLSDGDTLTSGEWEFKIHYAYNPTGLDGDPGFDEDEFRIALEVIPEPHSLGLILLGVAAVAVRRFRHAR